MLVYEQAQIVHDRVNKVMRNFANSLIVTAKGKALMRDDAHMNSPLRPFLTIFFLHV